MNAHPEALRSMHPVPSAYAATPRAAIDTAALAGAGAGREPAVRILSGGAAWRERAVAFVVATVPTLGLLPALLWARHDGFHARDLVLGVALYVFTLTGISTGFHRLFTHRAFTAPRPVRALLAVAGSMAWQGPLIRWVADHRRHHASTDGDGDPHSPHTGPGGAVQRFVHAHYGWFFDREKTRARRFAPDLVRDPMLGAIDRLHLVWTLLSLAVPAAAGGLWAGSVGGAVSALLWAGLVRIALVQHATWALNSVGHVWGTRPFATTDHSRNNAVLALLLMGEGWHNNHHAFPRAASLRLRAWQLDPSGDIILLLGKLGLASDIRRAPVSGRQPLPPGSISPASRPIS